MTGARLEVSDAIGRRVVEISKALFEIGRRETNDLRLAGSEVSRDHADIVTENGKIIIRDKTSSNEIVIDSKENKLSTKKAIFPGQQLTITLEVGGGSRGASKSGRL